MIQRTTLLGILILSCQVLASESLGLTWHYSKCAAYQTAPSPKGGSQLKFASEPVATGHIDIDADKLILNYDLTHGSSGAAVTAKFIGKDKAGVGQFKTLSDSRSPDILVAESAMKGRGGLILIKPENSSNLIFNCQRYEGP